uniref:Recombinase zinc beta ribbon domain n=1 Tax=Podoviridae sp. ctz6O13 TaxID=2827757 RepID=A0A8S5TKV8_9CAUD|nr:MAG TPA: Recombinase zinc beta ribbon domain [Podoviridae sp. ctz6O13]
MENRVGRSRRIKSSYLNYASSLVLSIVRCGICKKPLSDLQKTLPMKNPLYKGVLQFEDLKNVQL